MAQPTFGAPWDPLADVYGEQWVYEPLTSDPQDTENGDTWLRVDLDSGDKLATLRWDHGSGVWDIPVFPVGTSGNGVEEVRQVETPNGRGFIPILDSGSAFQQVGFQHGGTRYGLHDSVTAIPDSAIHRWKFGGGSGTTFADSIGSASGTLNFDAWQSGTWVDNYAIDPDGVDDFGETDSNLGWLNSLITDSWAVSFTINGVPSSGRVDFLSSTDANAEDYLAIGANDIADGAITSVVRGDGATANLWVFSSPSGIVNGGATYRVTVNKIGDVSQDNLEIWINGTERSVTQDFDENPSSINIDQPLQFFGETFGNYFGGLMDDVLIHNDSLTIQEITDDYDRQPWS